MSDKPTVVPLRAAPPLTDVVGQLRQLAANLERGVYGTPEFGIVVMKVQEQDDPILFGWGELPNHYTSAGVLLRAANIAARGGR